MEGRQSASLGLPLPVPWLAWRLPRENSLPHPVAHTFYSDPVVADETEFKNIRSMVPCVTWITEVQPERSIVLTTHLCFLSAYFGLSSWKLLRHNKKMAGKGDVGLNWKGIHSFCGSQTLVRDSGHKRGVGIFSLCKLQIPHNSGGVLMQLIGKDP